MRESKKERKKEREKGKWDLLHKKNAFSLIELRMRRRIEESDSKSQENDLVKGEKQVHLFPLL